MSDGLLPESFISHLVELRERLMKAMASILVIFLCLLPWAGKIYDLLAKPMIATLPPGTRMIATGVVTPFLIPLKVTLLAAFVLALPIVIYQAWAFVAPGLYAHEKRFALPVIVASTSLFLLGMAFCYFLVFNTVFRFIAEVAPGSITPAPDIASSKPSRTSCLTGAMTAGSFFQSGRSTRVRWIRIG